ncbi:MAG: thiamine-phosphate kinase [Hyphomicrobiales bacterium]|nr:thiamine-phosphate kinase [Hyphomicrobiales bacterium]
MSKRPPSAEDDFVARLIRPLAGEGAFNLEDDAALLVPPRGYDLVLKTDAIVMGVHSFPDDPPDLVARKALRMNLSDLAGKGAKPLGFLLTLALPSNPDQAWLAHFFEGLAEDSKSFACPLLGGDTTRTTGPFSASITIIGAARRGRMPTRLDARAGDLIAVTGTIGDAALGLFQRLEPERAALWGLSADEREHLASRYLLPQPRNALAAAIARHARAAMDISDGLVIDLERLCRASGLAARIDAERVPLSRAAQRALGADGSLIEKLLAGGDDYELLATLDRRSWPFFRAECEAKGVAASAIGETLSGEAGLVTVMRAGDELPLEQSGFSHL